MYWYARINENNIVTDVHASVPPSHAGSDISGQYYMNHVLNKSGRWLKTDFLTKNGLHFSPTPPYGPDGTSGFRGNFARPGMVYDEVADIFVPNKPYPSWVLNKNTFQYEPPVAMPVDENWYKWDEENLKWNLIMPFTGLQQIVEQNAASGIYSGQF